MAVEAPTRTIDVDIVIPVYNEERALPRSVRHLHAYLLGNFPFSWTITVADNASTDSTWVVARRLAEELPGVRAIHLDQKGRGRALRAAWSQSEAAVVAYMDVDLSTDLGGLLPLVAPLMSGHSDVAIGSRLAPGAAVERGPKREFVSRTYNLLLRGALRAHFSDAQCGFKAVRADVCRSLLDGVEDQAWFFDTELLVLAERRGLRIHEVPVDWTDDPDTRVDVVRTALDDLKGVVRLLRSGAVGAGRRDASRQRRRASTGQLLHFSFVGASSTVSFALLFALLFHPLGPIAADVVALLLSAVANVAANRRYTFASTGPGYWWRGAAAAVLPLALTVTALLVCRWSGVSGLGADLAVLSLANLTATLARFRLLSGR